MNAYEKKNDLVKNKYFNIIFNIQRRQKMLHLLNKACITFNLVNHHMNDENL
mgnify:CR=1 FL=1